MSRHIFNLSYSCHIVIIIFISLFCYFMHVLILFNEQRALSIWARCDVTERIETIKVSLHYPSIKVRGCG